MIYSLNGKLIFHDNNSAVVECGGVGYRCLITAKTLGGLPQLGEPVRLFTYLSVRQDGLDLFGFLTAKELDCFKLLTGINGVGPKMGLAILSQFAPEEIYAAIAAGDQAQASFRRQLKQAGAQVLERERLPSPFEEETIRSLCAALEEYVGLSGQPPVFLEERPDQAA